MSNRKAATEYILANIHKLLPDGVNRDLYTTFLNNMNEREFAAFMTDLKDSKKILKLIAPNGGKVKLNVERNLKLAKELGHDFFQHLILTDKATGLTYRTPKKYLVLKLPNRRQFQTLINKMSVASTQSVVDQYTNQPTGSSSKTSSLSAPEMNMLKVQGFQHSIVEFIKNRGGDSKALYAMNRLIFRNGSVSQAIIDTLNTKPKSTVVLDVFLTSAHIRNTLIPK